MSTLSESELDLDLHFLPAWARQSPAENRYAKYEGEPEEDRTRRRGERFGGRDQRRDRPPRREPGPGRPPRREAYPAERAEGRGERDRGFQPRPEGRRGGRREDRREEKREPPVPLPEVNVSITPEEKGVESLARRIKLTGRAYPLFDIAGLVLRQADRYHVHFSVKKDGEGKIIQPLYVCSLDESLWLNEDEVAAHVLKDHFAIFYQSERVPTEPPKGTYTFVAQCGMSGVILGPPNYHDYQNKLRKLHAERFANVPFDVFKSRVKIIRDEAVVKKWVEEQSFKTEYVALNVPEEVRLSSREALEKHFREVHLQNLLKTVEDFTMQAGRPVAMSPLLQMRMRRTLEEQRRFPLRVATVLSQQFANQGLQFFKVNKTITHVCVARPRYLDLQTTVVSEGVRRIVEFVSQTAGCTRRKLLEALAPAPPPPTPPALAALEEGTPTAGPVPTPGAPMPEQPTPEQTAVVTDLHWLIHQGHVLEFSDGRMEIAWPPRPKPPPPPPKTVKEPIQQAPPEAPAEEPLQPAGPEAPVEAPLQQAPPETPATPAEAAPESAAPAEPPPPLSQPPVEAELPFEEGLPVKEDIMLASAAAENEEATVPGEPAATVPPEPPATVAPETPATVAEPSPPQPA